MEPGRAAQGVDVASTLLKTVGAITGGNAESRAYKIAAKNAKKSAAYESAQLKQMAGQERATSQRQALEQWREGRLAQSRAIARAAASGAGASDPTVMKIIGDLAAEGDYNARAALFTGEETARGLEDKAAAALWQGKTDAAGYRTYAKAASRYGYMDAAGHLLTGMSSFYEKYGGDDDLDTPSAVQTYTSPRRISYWKIN